MKKWVTLIASALVFGLLAGGVMVGVNVAAGDMIATVPAQNQEVSGDDIEETQAEQEPERPPSHVLPPSAQSFHRRLRRYPFCPGVIR